MSFFIGLLMLCFGGAGTYMMINYIENDRYTYASPLTEHEVFILAVFFLCLIAAMIGLLMMIFAIVKKRNEENLQKITNTTGNNQLKNTCPQCGLNLTEGTNVCPKCHATMDHD